MVKNVKDKWIKLDKPLWFFGYSKKLQKLTDKKNKIGFDYNEIKQNLSLEEREVIVNKYHKLDKKLENYKRISFTDIVKYNDEPGLILKLSNIEIVLLGHCDALGKVDCEDHNSEYDSLMEYKVKEYYIIDLEKIINTK